MGEEPRSPRTIRERRRLQHAAVVLLCCWAFLASIGAIASLIATANNSAALSRANKAVASATAAVKNTDNNSIRISNEVVHGCIRLNIIRASDNKSHYADYKYISQQVSFAAASLHSNYLALRKIGIDPKVLARALKQSQAILATERIQADSKEWVPLTNCNAVALASGGKYTPPEPIPFSKQAPPPSAMNPLNATQPDPVGSLPNR